MNTPLHDRLAARFEIATAEPVEPNGTRYLGAFHIWCPVCADSDFMHEHHEDPRCSRVGDEAIFPTAGEARWINDRTYSPFTGGYRGRLRAEP